MHIATVEVIEDTLFPAVRKLRDTLDVKARTYRDLVMIGRTHLPDATPLTLAVTCLAHWLHPFPAHAASDSHRSSPRGNTGITARAQSLRAHSTR
jgi:fumarate hydratase class II